MFKKIITFSFFITLFSILPITRHASAACGIDEATISPSTKAESFDNSFYSESTAKNKEVTITVKTHECANKQPVYVSLTQYDTLERPTDSNGFHATKQTADTMHDISGNLVSGNPNVRVLDKKKITFSTNSFKITLHPGEDLCGIAVGIADCRYGVRVGLSKNTYDYFSRNTIQENNPRLGGNLDYDCDGLCDNPRPWEFVKVVTIPDVVVPGEPPIEPKPVTPSKPTNLTPVVPNQFSSGVSDACSGGDCYSLFSGFADAVGSKFSAIKDADGLGGLVNAIIAFGIGLGGVLAVAMIMYQGFLYMKSDNVSTLTSIKGKIINTILGFLLLLTIYTLLRTINPDLLNLDTRIDASTLTTIPDRSQDADYQKGLADLGGTEISVDPTEYNDPIFVGYLYHQQGAGGAPSILWAAQKGLSQVPKETPFIKPSAKGNATIVNRNMRNNINVSDMNKLIGSTDVTPANFLKYWAKKVGAVKQDKRTIPNDIMDAVTRAASTTGNTIDSMRPMCIIESGCNRPAADKGNGQGYYGLFQVSTAVFSKHGPKNGTILDYYANAVAGGNYLKENMASYTRDIKKIK